MCPWNNSLHIYVSHSLEMVGEKHCLQYWVPGWLLPLLRHFRCFATISVARTRTTTIHIFITIIIIIITTTTTIVTIVTIFIVIILVAELAQ